MPFPRTPRRYLYEAEAKKIELLYELYRSRAYYTALKILADHYLAEEAVAETFKYLCSYPKALAKFAADKSPNDLWWLRLIVRGRVYNLLNREKRFQYEALDLHPNLVASGFTPEEISIQSEDYATLLEQLDKLDEDYADALFLRYCTEFDISEIASLLGITKDNVYQRLSRGSRMLLELLRKNADE